MRANLDAADRNTSGPSPQDAFDAGRTTLSLDHISDEELDAFFFEEESSDESWLNAPTLTGLALIVIGLVYLLAEMGILSGIALPAMVSLLPWLAGIFVVVLGFGLLSRGRSDTKKERAARSTASPSRSRAAPKTSAKTSSSPQPDRSPDRSSGSTSGSTADEGDTSSTFEFPEPPSSSAWWNPFGNSDTRLRRSMSDKRIMGVCSGIARYLNLDPTLVRIAFVIGLIVTGGQFVLAYIALGWVMPKDTELTPEERMRIIRDS
jgi:phage shock protein C